MNDLEFEALRNEIYFLQNQVDRLREQNRTLINLIIKMREDDGLHITRSNG